MARRLAASPQKRAGLAFCVLFTLFVSVNALILGVCCYHTLRLLKPTWTESSQQTLLTQASAAASMHIQLVDAANPLLVLSQADLAASRLRARFLPAGDTLLVGVIAGANTSLAATTMQSLLSLSGTRSLLYIPARVSGYYGEEALLGTKGVAGVRGAAVRGTHHAAPCAQHAELCPALDFAQLAGFAWAALAPRYMLFVDAGSVLLPPDAVPLTAEDHHPVRLIARHQQNRTAVCRHTYHDGLVTRGHPWSSTLFEGPELPRLAGLVRRFAAGPLTLARLFQEACDLRPGAVGVVAHPQPRFGVQLRPRLPPEEPSAVEDERSSTAGPQDALPTHWYADVAFVIPTVSRPGAFYINETVAGLARAIRAAAMEPRSLIIVQVSGASAALIEAHYKHTLHLATPAPLATPQPYSTGGSVAVEVHKAPIHTYPDLEQATKFTYGDSPARVRWRSQQNLDYASLFGLAQHRARFVVMMEDDVTPVSDTVVADMWQRMTDSSHSSHSSHWSTIDFCSTVGFAGKAFAQSEVESMAFLLRAYYDEKPCDWIYPAHLAALTGRPALQYGTPLFQHNGKVRSIPRGA